MINEYSFNGWSSQDIAEDMISYCPDLENADIDDVTREIRIIRGIST